MSGLQMKYFVLKPAGKSIYAKASRKAMRAYAYIIEKENPELALDLLEWADRETELAGVLSKGILYCEKHGGHGFISDCLICNPFD